VLQTWCVQFADQVCWQPSYVGLHGPSWAGAGVPAVHRTHHETDESVWNDPERGTVLRGLWRGCESSCNRWNILLHFNIFSWYLAYCILWKVQSRCWQALPYLTEGKQFLDATFYGSLLCVIWIIFQCIHAVKGAA